jgi:hypothetical protein
MPDTLAAHLINDDKRISTILPGPCMSEMKHKNQQSVIN